MSAESSESVVLVIDHQPWSTSIACAGPMFQPSGSGRTSTLDQSWPAVLVL